MRLTAPSLISTQEPQTLELADLSIGDEAIVEGYSNSDAPFVRQLMQLGLIPGTRFQVMRLAPLGDPVEIKFRGFSLALRSHEAAVLKLRAP